MAVSDSHWCNCLVTHLSLVVQILIERLKTKVTRQSTLDEQTLTAFPLSLKLSWWLSVSWVYGPQRGGVKFVKAWFVNWECIVVISKSVQWMQHFIGWDVVIIIVILPILNAQTNRLLVGVAAHNSLENINVVEFSCFRARFELTWLQSQKANKTGHPWKCVHIRNIIPLSLLP